MMKRIALLLALMLCIASIMAYCPNACSGHGTCGDRDRCTCHTRVNGAAAFTGADCSLYTCPYGTAWVSKATDHNEAHGQAECSNVGTCLRSTGACQCKPGFSGKACNRMDQSVANHCNGRGVWQTQAQFATDASLTYAGWDKDVTGGCKCDLGYRGHNCELVECPTGQDPLGGPDKDQGRDCSGRGKCSYSTGTCSCFPGYTGQACATQCVLN